MNIQKTTDVLIIGSGLTGLSAAHYLRKAGIDFIVIERNSEPGGVIKTCRENGFIYEKGPNTGVIGSEVIADIFEDLKDHCKLETASKEAKNRYILKEGKWAALPTGLVSGIKTLLFTTKDKIRLLAEPFRKKGSDPHETLSELVKRRMGQSFLDYAVDPFILGIYAGNPDTLIPKYALPKLYNLEQNYGSFIGGAIKKQFEKKTTEEKKITREVFSAQGGLSNLVDALYKSTGENNFIFSAKNIVVKPFKEIYKVCYRANEHASEIYAKNVILTTGAYELPTLLPFISKAEMSKITKLQYAKVTVVTLGFRKWNGMRLDGFGGLVPYKENSDILGFLFLSTLFSNRAPDEGALITAFMGGTRNERVAALPDSRIYDIVKKETANLLKINDFNPDLFKINRYEHAIPQYEVSSAVRLAAINKAEQEFPGLLLGGNIRDGIGMADRAKQGKLIAEQIIKYNS